MALRPCHDGHRTTRLDICPNFGTIGHLSELETNQGHETLREVVETLAPLERRAGSPAEREAAQWIAARLDRAGAPARVEEEEFYDGYARQLLPLGAAGALAGALALSRRRRALPAAIAVAAAAAIVDDASNGTRLWRRLISKPRKTWNVVGEAGDREGPRTLVVLAHHDAAPTGKVFDQSAQKWLARRFPELIERGDTSIPLWWPVAGGPALVALGALARRPKLLAAGTAMSALNVGLGADIARSPVVPGANDNLSAVAALVRLAELLRVQPVQRVRVLLVSCGAEEVLQGGIYGFAARHFPGLDRDRTFVLNLDTIGSPELFMLEGEGPFKMEMYPGAEFRDLVARAAERTGVPLKRGLKSRSSTDSVIPARAGYPTACLASWEPGSKVLSNYHLMTDTPENLHYDTIARAVTIGHAVAEDLGKDGAG
jgi:acetylornithine deacetylase/succinyl-diaminopimelate desuccinylase-like protein